MTPGTVKGLSEVLGHKYSGLKKLAIANCSCTKPKEILQLTTNFLSKAYSLTHLCLRAIDISSEVMEELCTSFKYFKLTHLSLSANIFGKNGFKYLVNAIRKGRLTELRELDISDLRPTDATQHISDASIESLAQILHLCPKLKYINLSMNPNLTAVGMKRFIDIIHSKRLGIKYNLDNQTVKTEEKWDHDFIAMYNSEDSKVPDNSISGSAGASSRPHKVAKKREVPAKYIPSNKSAKGSAVWDDNTSTSDEEDNISDEEDNISDEEDNTPQHRRGKNMDNYTKLKDEVRRSHHERKRKQDDDSSHEQEQDDNDDNNIIEDFEDYADSEALGNSEQHVDSDY